MSFVHERVTLLLTTNDVLDHLLSVSSASASATKQKQNEGEEKQKRRCLAEINPQFRSRLDNSPIRLPKSVYVLFHIKVYYIVHQSPRIGQRITFACWEEFNRHRTLLVCSSPLRLAVPRSRPTNATPFSFYTLHIYTLQFTRLHSTQSVEKYSGKVLLLLYAICSRFRLHIFLVHCVFFSVQFDIIIDLRRHRYTKAYIIALSHTNTER